MVKQPCSSKRTDPQVSFRVDGPYGVLERLGALNYHAIPESRGKEKWCTEIGLKIAKALPRDDYVGRTDQEHSDLTTYTIYGLHFVLASF